MRLVALALVVAAASAQAAETVQVNSFNGASNLPLWVGQHEGMFARAGIAVALTHPAGSVEQIKGLVAGKYDICATALDNVVVYHDGHGEADLGGPIDAVAISGLDGGFLTLVAAPELKEIAALKGKMMAVDALSTGFSFALQDLLARAGVGRDAVQYVEAGSSGERWKALQAGTAQAALLSMPLDLEAADKGFNALVSVAGALGHYQATVMAARQSWAAAHAASVIAYLRGYREAVAWLVAPEHKDAAIAILHQEIPGLASARQEQVYGELLDQRAGIRRDLGIDPAGAEMVLALRARYAVPPMPAQDWHRYVDLTYLEKAR